MWLRIEYTHEIVSTHLETLPQRISLGHAQEAKPFASQGVGTNGYDLTHDPTITSRLLEKLTSFFLSSIDCRYCSLPYSTSVFFFRYGSIDLYCS